MSNRVLVVDDDDDLAGLLVDMLTKSRRHVTRASNGQVALDLLRAGARPAVIVLDMRMPVMDGATFLQHRALAPELARIPVIVLTAEDWVTSDLASAVTAVLPKPVPLDRLRELVDLLCQAPWRLAAGTRRMVAAAPAAAPPGLVERRLPSARPRIVRSQPSAERGPRPR